MNEGVEKQPTKSDAGISDVHNDTYESGWRYIFAFAVMIMWLVGVVVAKGGWSTIFSAVIPPYALYLCVEWILHLLGLV